MKHIFKNKNNDKTLILLHGTGGDENSLISLAEKIDSSANLLGLRGRIDENGKARFFKRENNTYDLKSLEEETKQLYETIISLSEKYQINLNNVTFIGFSNGANILVSLIQYYPNQFKKFALLSPDYVNEEKRFQTINQTKVFISSSREDEFVDFDNVDKLIFDLKVKKADVELHLSRGHKIDNNVLNSLKEWYLNN